MNKLTNGLNAVKRACENKGYTFRTIGGDGINTASSIFINNFEIKTGSLNYDNEDMNMLAEIIDGHDMSMVKEVFCDKSMTYSNNCYVKESYRNGKISLADVVRTAIEGSSYSKDTFKSIKENYIKTNFSVTSAFLYKGMYITPYMPITLLVDILNNNISKEYLKEFMSIYMNKKTDKVNKKDVQNIAGYLFKSYIVDNNISLLDEVDMHAII